MKKKYICICDREFDNPQSFNAHKSRCKSHFLNKYGNLDYYYQRQEVLNKRITQSRCEHIIKEKEKKLQKWLKEEHRCECCGKIMTEYFGSGRFCSRSCANSRKHSKETKDKISKNLKNNPKQLKNVKRKTFIIRKNYSSNPKFCSVCGKKLPFNLRKRTTCSDVCRSKHLSLALKGKTGGYREGSGSKKFKKGYYKGIYCDSTWELVYVIYNIDHNIPFKRCKRAYKYEYNGEKHKYYPDFELEDGTIVEIKGYDNGTTEAKINSVTDRPIKVLYENDLKYAFDYVKENYTYDKLEDLFNN